MKKILSKLVFVTIFAFIFVVRADAQLCGSYSTVFSVGTTGGKPVDNAVVRLLPVGKNETRGKRFARDENDPSKFSITFSEGHLIYGKYKIIISAKGFKTHEFETGFPHCERRNFILKLEKSGSETKNNLEEIRTVNFRAVDENKKAVGNVKIAVSWEKGKVSEKISDDYGQADFKVFNNKILKVRFEKDGYKTREIEIDLSKDDFLYKYVQLEKAEP